MKLQAFALAALMAAAPLSMSGAVSRPFPICTDADRSQPLWCNDTDREAKARPERKVVKAKPKKPHKHKHHHRKHAKKKHGHDWFKDWRKGHHKHKAKHRGKHRHGHKAKSRSHRSRGFSVNVKTPNVKGFWK